MLTAILPKADFNCNPLTNHFAHALRRFIDELEVEFRSFRHVPLDAPHRSILRAAHHLLAGLLEIQDASNGARPEAGKTK